MKSKSPEKEEEIYRVVLEITAEVGLSGLKMSNIAKQAGLAHGTVYIYFKNKKDLINQLFKKAKNRATSSIGVYDHLLSNFFEGLKSYWEAYLAYLINNQKETHFIRQCMSSPFLEQTSLELSDLSKQKLVVFFEKGKAEKYIKNLETELLMSVFSGVAYEIVAKINDGRLTYSPDLIANSFDLCWNAIRR